MRCFCCDCLLDNPSPDWPTGRFYCSVCFEPTNQVILSLEDKELDLEILGFEGLFGVVTRDEWSEIISSDEFEFKRLEEKNENEENFINSDFGWSTEED